MRHICTITIGLFFCAFSANGQTLGQVAEKEIVRRANLGKKHPSKVITEAQLGSGRGDEIDAADEPSVSEDAFSVPEASVVSFALDNLAESVDADPWAELYEDYQTAYRDAKEMLSDAEAFKSYCDDGTAPP